MKAVFAAVQGDATDPCVGPTSLSFSLDAPPNFGSTVHPLTKCIDCSGECLSSKTE